MSVRAYAYGVALAGAICLGYVALTLRVSAIDPLTLAALVLLAAVAQRLPVLLFRSSAVSVSFAAVIASIVLYGTGIGVLVSLTQAAVNSFTPTRKPFVKVAFNTGAFALSAFTAGELFGLVAPRPGDLLGIVWAAIVAAGGYFVVNSTLAAMVIALDQRLSVLQVWRTNYAWMPVNFLATAAQGAALAIAAGGTGVFGVFMFTLPLALAWYSFHLYMAKSTEVRARNAELERVNETLSKTNDRLEKSHLSVIGALIGALEASDDTRARHAERIMASAAETAARLGCTDDEVATVRLAAMFHDIGTIGVPASILRKAGPLEPEDLHAVRAHTTIGANLLAHVPTLARLCPIVLAHHEHYDGSGYPNGSRGDEIPLAAQIIAVADAYEAMTSERPHRRAVAPDDAVRELRANAGTQFNPVIVEAFIEQLAPSRSITRSATAPQLLRTALEAIRPHLA